MTKKVKYRATRSYQCFGCGRKYKKEGKTEKRYHAADCLCFNDIPTDKYALRKLALRLPDIPANLTYDYDMSDKTILDLHNILLERVGKEPEFIDLIYIMESGRPGHKKIIGSYTPVQVAQMRKEGIIF